jgi:type IV secretory pathway VirB2 component (pilin)
MNVAHLIQTTKTSVTANKIGKAGTDCRFLAAGLACLLGALACMPELALAAPWDSVATNVLGIFTNGLTRTIAIISVIACGIAALFGKLSYDWAFKIVVGIALIFGSAAFVDYVIAAAS